jgi:hypothetical protein
LVGVGAPGDIRPRCKAQFTVHSTQYTVHTREACRVQGGGCVRKGSLASATRRERGLPIPSACKGNSRRSAVPVCMHSAGGSGRGATLINATKTTSAHTVMAAIFRRFDASASWKEVENATHSTTCSWPLSTPTVVPSGRDHSITVCPWPLWLRSRPHGHQTNEQDHVAQDTTATSSTRPRILARQQSR